MGQPEQTEQTPAQPETKSSIKKPYQKPEFRFERVFETRALACGKISVTQAQCAHNRKTS